MALDPQLLEILACPDTHHAPLDHDPEGQTLTCTECGRIFPIRDDIPILLLDEATFPAAGQGAAATDRESADNRGTTEEPGTQLEGEGR